ncbi:MAG: Inorganic pyrophosphatase, partial [uncultured Sphingomonadaceae bacterium]
GHQQDRRGRRRAQQPQRDHRSADRRRAGEVRVRQGQRRLVRRPHPAHADALPGELRLRAAHVVRRRRPAGRAGGGAVAFHPRFGSARPANRSAALGRRARRRREASLRTRRQDFSLLRRGRRPRAPAGYRVRADRALLHPLQGSGGREVGARGQVGRRGGSQAHRAGVDRGRARRWRL